MIPDSLWEVIDPISAIGAFIFTLAILYNQGKERYMNSLESRLSVEFKAKMGESFKTILEVQQAYLASKSDIRSWAQSLGQQMTGGSHLKFDMNWDDDEKMKVERDSGQYFKHYRIKIYLAENPLKSNKKSFITFLDNKENYIHSHVEIFGDKSNPEKIIWKRNPVN